MYLLIASNLLERHTILPADWITTLHIIIIHIGQPTSDIIHHVKNLMSCPVTEESLNKGHLGAAFLFFVRRLSSLRGLKCN